MKKSILIIAILFSINSFAQIKISSIITPIGSINDLISISQNKEYELKVISKYDTMILFKGIDTIPHNHEYVEKTKELNYMSCAVYHGEEGCPATWLNKEIICTICLKNMQIKEDRTVKKEKIINKFDEAKNRLNEFKKLP